jgi:hypothetical protein
VAPTPMSRPSLDVPGPDDEETSDLAETDMILPASKTPAMMVATRDTLPAADAALGAISSVDQSAPSPIQLMAPDTVLTAYAPESTPDPGAQLALRMIIERETTAAAAAPPVALTAAAPLIDPGIRPSETGGTNGLSIASNFFDMTWSAVAGAGDGTRIASTLTNTTIDRDPLVGLKERKFDLVAPEIDHVNETLATPLPMTDVHYADLYEPEGYLDNTSELGPMANRIHLESDLVAPPRYDRFIVRRPLLVAPQAQG